MNHNKLIDTPHYNRVEHGSEQGTHLGFIRGGRPGGTTHL